MFDWLKWFMPVNRMLSSSDAEIGNAVAQYKLGLCYFRGVGVCQDFVQAKKWFEKAAAQGHVGAKAMLKHFTGQDSFEAVVPNSEKGQGSSDKIFDRCHDEKTVSSSHSRQYASSTASHVISSAQTNSSEPVQGLNVFSRHVESVNPFYNPAIYQKESEIVSLFAKEWLSIACREFIVIDIETTGLSKYSDSIIEVAAIKYQNCTETEKFTTLINPNREIPYQATQIHGITNDMVKDAPPIEATMPQLLAFLQNYVLVGHNAHFDIGFIEANAKRLGYNTKWNYIDTISIAKKILPRLPNYKLLTVLNAINYKQIRHHRAEDDCKGCAEIIKTSIKHLTKFQDTLTE